MRTQFFVYVLFIFCIGNANAQNSDLPAEPLVTVTLEINRLEQSLQLLDETITRLDASLQQLAGSPERLTPEQIEAYGALSNDVESMLVSLQDTMAQVGPTVESIRDPSSRFLGDMLSTSREELVEPVTDEIRGMVRNWIFAMVFAMLLLLAVVGVALYVALGQVRDIANVLRSIADEYQIVPRESETLE